MSQHEQLRTYCKSLRLPSLSEVLVETLACSTRILVHRDPSPPPAGTRGRGPAPRRIERFLREAQLPPGKTLALFDQSRLPLRIRRLLPHAWSRGIL
ncbi:MAG: hypothetical protein R3A44_10340 [Caldilineaceae bacterium]